MTEKNTIKINKKVLQISLAHYLLGSFSSNNKSVFKRMVLQSRQE